MPLDVIQYLLSNASRLYCAAQQRISSIIIIIIFIVQMPRVLITCAFWEASSRVGFRTEACGSAEARAPMAWDELKFSQRLALLHLADLYSRFQLEMSLKDMSEPDLAHVFSEHVNVVVPEPMNSILPAPGLTSRRFTFAVSVRPKAPSAPAAPHSALVIKLLHHFMVMNAKDGLPSVISSMDRCASFRRPLRNVS